MFLHVLYLPLRRVHRVTRTTFPPSQSGQGSHEILHPRYGFSIRSLFEHRGIINPSPEGMRPRPAGQGLSVWASGPAWHLVGQWLGRHYTTVPFRQLCNLLLCQASYVTYNLQVLRDADLCLPHHSYPSHIPYELKSLHMYSFVACDAPMAPAVNTMRIL